MVDVREVAECIDRIDAAPGPETADDRRHALTLDIADVLHAWS